MPEKTFKERYSDPEFKKRYMVKVLTKVTCPCGVTTSRCNMSCHKKSKTHAKNMKNKEADFKLEKDKMTADLARLKDVLEQNNLTDLLKLIKPTPI